MKGFYIENFVARLIFCVVGMVLIFTAVRFIMCNFVWHEPFTISVFNLAISVACGVVEAFTWKPKE